SPTAAPTSSSTRSTPATSSSTSSTPSSRSSTPRAARPSTSWRWRRPPPAATPRTSASSPTAATCSRPSTSATARPSPNRSARPESRRPPPAPDRLRPAAQVSGGHDQAKPAEVWDPGDEKVNYAQDLWPYVLIGVLALFLLDLYAKRVRLFGYRTIKFQ